MNTVLSPLSPVVHEDSTPLGGRDLAEVLAVLHDEDSPARSELVAVLASRLRSYDRVSLLEIFWDDLREVVRAAPIELGMEMVSATASCDPSCRVRSFWRHLVASVLGQDLSFGVPPLN